MSRAECVSVTATKGTSGAQPILQEDTAEGPERMNGETGAALQGSQTFTGEEVLNLRVRGRLPQGKCIYIQSGDPGDFDGGWAGCKHSRSTRTQVKSGRLTITPTIACLLCRLPHCSGRGRTTAEDQRLPVRARGELAGPALTQRGTSRQRAA